MDAAHWNRTYIGKINLLQSWTLQAHSDGELGDSKGCRCAGEFTRTQASIPDARRLRRVELSKEHQKRSSLSQDNQPFTGSSPVFVCSSPPGTSWSPSMATATLLSTKSCPGEMKSYTSELNSYTSKFSRMYKLGRALVIVWLNVLILAWSREPSWWSRGQDPDCIAQSATEATVLSLSGAWFPEPHLILWKARFCISELENGGTEI